MFDWINSQGVRSDKGFEVESVGRFEIEYREGPKKINVYVENGISAGRPCVIIMSEDCFEKWDNDPAGEQIPGHRQKEMLDNFIEALEFQKLAVVKNW